MSGDQGENRIKFGRERIKLVEPPDAEQVRAVRDWLQLPENLTGRSILELFSGDRENSLYAVIRHMGGRYKSLDLDASDIPGHVIGDAIHADQFFPHHSFDYIVMKYPVLWKRYATGLEKLFLNTPEKDYNIDVAKTMAVIKAAMELLKPQKGNFIAIAGGLTTEDADKMFQTIQKEIVDLDPQWYVRTLRIADYTQRPTHHLFSPMTLEYDHSRTLHLFHY